MTAIEILASRPWVDRLGWTLVHFLWQGALIALVYTAVRALARTWRPNTRYLLACLVLGTMLLAPLVTWRVLGSTSAVAPSTPEPTSPALNAAPATHSAPLPALPRVSHFRTLKRSWMPWVVTSWLAGALFFSIRLLGGWVAALRLRKRLVSSPSGDWQHRFDRLKSRVAVSRTVRLLVSALAETPMVIGWVRPVVLLPVAALTGLTPEQVELLLLHELAHIRRCDYLVNLLQSIAEASLFYHPAVWWVSRDIRRERELCCDEVAIAATGDVVAYARTLAVMEGLRVSPSFLQANGGSLVERIAHLVGEPRPAQRNFSVPVAVAVVLLTAAGFALFAQSTGRPKFEVASIKPSQEMSFMAIRALPGGRLTVNAPVRLMIQNAYRLQPFQIVNGPGWIDTERYAIEAKAEGNPDRAQMMDMLQSLLEDRFELKARRETRQLPVYNLVATKGGIKQVRSTQPCVDFPTDGPPPAPAGRGQAQPAPCGHIIISLTPRGARMTGDSVPMTELTRILAVVLGRTVIDKTGYADKLNVDLPFTPDTVAAGLPPTPVTAPAPSGAMPPAEPANPSITTVLQQDLGLKLESGKGPVEILVIDHVKKPSAN